MNLCYALARARRPIDLGHIRHYCSGAIDRAPADDGMYVLEFEIQHHPITRVPANEEREVELNG